MEQQEDYGCVFTTVNFRDSLTKWLESLDGNRLPRRTESPDSPDRIQSQASGVGSGKLYLRFERNGPADADICLRFLKSNNGYLRCLQTDL